MVYYAGSVHPSAAGYRVPPPTVPRIPLGAVTLKRHDAVGKLPVIRETVEKVERAVEPSIRKMQSKDK